MCLCDTCECLDFVNFNYSVRDVFEKNVYRAIDTLYFNQFSKAFATGYKLFSRIERNIDSLQKVNFENCTLMRHYGLLYLSIIEGVFIVTIVLPVLERDFQESLFGESCH
jgi:hypothetical protein